MEVVDDDAADPGCQRLGQLLPRLVVAVEVDASGGKPALERDEKLAAGDYVEIQPFLGEKLGDGGAEISFRRIGGLGRAGVVPGQRVAVGAGRVRSVSSSKTYSGVPNAPANADAAQPPIHSSPCVIRAR